MYHDVPVEIQKEKKTKNNRFKDPMQERAICTDAAIVINSIRYKDAKTLSFLSVNGVTQ